MQHHHLVISSRTDIPQSDWQRGRTGLSAAPHSCFAAHRVEAKHQHGCSAPLGAGAATGSAVRATCLMPLVLPPVLSAEGLPYISKKGQKSFQGAAAFACSCCPTGLLADNSPFWEQINRHTFCSIKFSWIEGMQEMEANKVYQTTNIPFFYPKTSMYQTQQAFVLCLFSKWLVNYSQIWWTKKSPKWHSSPAQQGQLWESCKEDITWVQSKGTRSCESCSNFLHREIK